MKKIILGVLFSLCLAANANAGVVTRYNTYATNGEVNSANLNGNFDNILSEVNGGLDNTNMDTVSGYRLMEVVGALPAVGTQGRVAFLTTDDTLNFDTGAAWTRVVTSSGTPAQGDILYYSGSAWARLAAGTANYPLVTNGAAANPAFELLDVANAVTGILPAANGGTGTTGILLGTWNAGAPYAENVTYGPATTDSFFVGRSTSNGAAVSYSIKTDSATPPTTEVQVITLPTNSIGSFCTPVKKGDYILVTKTSGTGAVGFYSIPLGN